ncbi:Myb family transcription factor [Chloropicon roscoffensis]|uniref:Myb family transcription factor n=1 Tax=Chloropicon roscoffensis TaxID=1461544 RepID=A0AAX4P4V0_9CHLO|mmetsp:Transcript_4977/g.15099  ORF Transcript_4977/g.15099 Transcript_4977/m.15099 type:complete len:449 (-) Transcript_4977:476-1822(-)
MSAAGRHKRFAPTSPSSSASSEEDTSSEETGTKATRESSSSSSEGSDSPQTELPVVPAGRDPHELVFRASDALRRVIKVKTCTRQEASSLVWEYAVGKGLLEETRPAGVAVKAQQDEKLSRVLKGSYGRGDLKEALGAHLFPLQEPSDAPELGEEETWGANEERTSRKRKGAYSLEEDAIIRRKVREVALRLNLSTEDYSWLFSTGTKGRSAKNGKGIWSQIARALPNRHVRSVYDHGKRLFNKSHGCSGEVGRWSDADEKALREAVESYGTSRWKKVSEIVGRPEEACRQHYNKVTAVKQKGKRWTEEEEEALESVVKKFLENRARSEVGVEHRRQRDDIPWKRLAEDHGFGRTGHQCMCKWYSKLCPSMVDAGQWGPGEDTVMLRSLAGRHQGKSEWEVDWGDLVPNRSVAQAKRRWLLMLKHIPEYKDRTFSDQVAYLRDKFLRD